MIAVGSTTVITALTIGLALVSTPALAGHYKCKALADDTIILTPFENDTVALAFNDGAPAEMTTYSHKGNVFTAEFQNVTGHQGATLIYILDTQTNNGYEFGHLPPKPAFATKMTCWWLER
jgi:hypothetical protein